MNWQIFQYHKDSKQSTHLITVKARHSADALLKAYKALGFKKNSEQATLYARIKQ